MADYYVKLPPTSGSGSGVTSLNSLTGDLNIVAGTGISVTPAGSNITIAATGGSGTVTSVSVVTANGLAGTVATATTTPALTLSTTVTGVLKGDGTAISAAISGTDYSAGTSALSTGILKSTTTTGALTIAVAGDFPTLPYISTTLGATATSGGLSVSTNTLSAAQATTSTNGWLSSTDWNTFSGKQSTLTIGALDAQAANANGLALVSNVLSLQSADSTHPGAVNTTTQTLAGNKTFSGQTSIANATSTALTINTTSFVFDASINALGIGVAPTANTIIDSATDTSAANQAVQLTGYGSGNVSFRTRRARGTAGSPTAVQSGDVLGSYGALGYGTSQFAALNTGFYRVIAGETFTNTSNATYLTLSTTPTTSVTASERMRVASTGNILIGTTTDDGANKLQVAGSSTVTSETIAGTGGNGFTNYTVQSSTPATPAAGFDLYADSTGRFSFVGTNGFVKTITGAGMTASRVYTLPDATGTFALTNINPSATITTVNSAASPYTILATDTFILVDTSGGAVTLNLPNPANRQAFRIKDSKGTFNTNNVTLVRFGSEKIEGLAASLVLSANWGIYGFGSDGTDWYKLLAAQNASSKTFTSSTTFTIPAGVTQMIVAGRGGSAGGAGGGGGGGGSSSAGAKGGGGGSSGGSTVTRIVPFTVVPGTSTTVTIGAGGTAGSAGAGAVANVAGATGTNGGNGTAGGDSTFGTLVPFKGGFASNFGTAGGLSTGGGGGVAANLREGLSQSAAGTGGATNVAGTAASAGGNSFRADRGVGSTGGTAGGTNGGGGGGAGSNSSAGDDAGVGLGGLGGNAGAAGADGSNATGVTGTPTSGAGGAGGAGGGGGGLLAVTGTNGGAGTAGQAGNGGYITIYWTE